jgi:O-antigen/teichoic acid export membrane protein
MIDVSRKGVSAVKWSAASSLTRTALQIVGQVFLARRLGPDIYGIFSIGLVVFTFSNFLATFGFSWALLQLVDLREDDIRFSFTWQLASGVAAALALYFLAPLLAGYFHDVRVRPVIQWLAVACVLNAAASPAFNLLMRDLNFRATGLVDVVSYTLGYIAVGIPLAWAGAGVYSLVAAWLVQSSVKLVGSFLLRPHSVRPLFWYDRVATMLSVGSTVFVTNLGNWFLDNLDRLLIGRLLDARAVGLYNVGYNLANRPNSLLVNALQPAFFSASARLQGDPRRIQQAYLQVVATIWVVVAPLFVLLSFISIDLVRLLYGPSWTPAGGVLTTLFLAMPLYVTWGASTPVLWNTGRKHYESLLQLPLLFMAVCAFYYFAPIGIHAAALVTAGLLASRGLVVSVAAFRAVGLRLSDLLPYLLRSALLSTLAAAGAWLGQYITVPLGHPFVSLISACLVALVLVLSVVCALPVVLGSHPRVMVVRFIPKLKRFLSLPDAPPVDPNVGSGNG